MRVRAVHCPPMLRLLRPALGLYPAHILLPKWRPPTPKLLSVNSHLIRLFPHPLFLTSLYLIPEIVLSNRVLAALKCKDGIGKLRSLRGLKVSVPMNSPSPSPMSQVSAPSPSSSTFH